MKEKIRTDRFRILSWGGVAFFTLLYASLIFNQNVWTDEIFTLKLIQNDFAGIVEGTAADVHPPLYYFLARAALLIFGDSLQVQKLVTILPMSLTLLLGATKVRRQFSDATACFFIWTLGCLPCTMEYAVQVRMYSMALLAVTACGLSALEAFETEKRGAWIGLTVSALAAAWLHYFALGSVLLIQGFLLLALLLKKRRKLKCWLAAAAVMIAGYAPWAGVFLRQSAGVAQSYWIPEITWSTVADYFQWAFGINKWKWPAWAFTALAVGAGIMAVSGAAKRRREETAALLAMLVPALTAAAGVILSFLIRPVYRDQYVFPAMGLFCLFFAVELSRLVKRKAILIPVCLFLLFLGAVQYLETWRQEYRSTLTDQTVEFWEEHVGEDDLIVYNLEVYEFCYSYYFPEEKLSYVRDVDLDQEFDEIWFLDTPGEWEFVPPQILPYDLQIEYMGHYGIEHNEFDIYRVTKGPNPQPLPGEGAQG